ncbi:MAG: carboxylating nicotinate-nucleotide diphosphorylase [Methanobrevibacter sp.]|jgi:nicotinate-nucleotide pyrophosphorylase (carboxylating)|nr:carboxylating nicotinate-nucleotide diphosphorylase [Candidatus Methanovirga aequatorialis]
MKEIIKHIIEEDIGFEDITTNFLIDKDKITKSTITSKENGIIAGVEIAKEIFSYYNLDIVVLKDDGDGVSIDDTIMEIEGNAHLILKLERTVLNILMRMSGIATITNQLVMKVNENAEKEITIAGTRKTLPGLGFLDKRAIKLGGGDSHRFSLDDLVLIKDNHIAIVGSLEKAIELAKKNVSFTKKIEVEVEDWKDGLKAAELGADIIMLDNMNIDEITKTIAILEEKNLRDKVTVEVSGGINPENIVSYGKTNVDVISLGSITHSVKSLDLSLNIE